MRPSLTVAVVLPLAVLSCAHSEAPARAPLGGSVGGLHFDQTSVTGASTSMALAPDGTWRGYLENMWFEARRSGDVFQSSWGSVPVIFEPRSVTVHEYSGDLVLSRLDGGAVPDELVLPLWLAIRRWATQVQKAPSGRCVEVESIGTVLVLILPRPRVHYGVDVQSGCNIRFVEPVVGDAPGHRGS